MQATRKPKFLGKAGPLLGKKLPALLGMATLAALGLAAAQPAHAQATFYTNAAQFAAAVSNSQSINFDAAAGPDPGGTYLGTTYTDSATGTTFTDNNGVYVNPKGGTFGYSDSSDIDLLSANPATIATSSSAIGFDFSTTNGDDVVFTAGGQSFTEAGPVGPSFSSTPGYAFLGVIYSGPGPLSLSTTAYNLFLRDVTVADPVTTTPEPSSVAAFGFTAMGAAGLVLKARKRRSAA